MGNPDKADFCFNISPCVLLVWYIHVPLVCSARVIFESDLMQDFLELKQNKGTTVNKEDSSSPAQGRKVERKPDLRVLLPNHTIVTVSVSEHWRTPEVFQVQYKVHMHQIYNLKPGSPPSHNITLILHVSQHTKIKYRARGRAWFEATRWS